jgi:hypothetical protein
MNKKFIRMRSISSAECEVRSAKCGMGERRARIRLHSEATARQGDAPCHRGLWVRWAGITGFTRFAV